MIDPIGQSISGFPAGEGHRKPGARQPGFPAERAQIAASVTIDLNSDQADSNVVTVIRDSDPREPTDSRSNHPEPAMLEIEASFVSLPSEHKKYQVVAMLGTHCGFGEKGRILNAYL